MPTQLRQLDGRRIAVEVTINGQDRVFNGRGRYTTDAKLGAVLVIKIEDLAGSFEFMIQESTWTGDIVADEGGEADYRLNVGAEHTCFR